MTDDLGTSDRSPQQTREPGNLYGPRSRLKYYWRFTREQNVRVKAIEAKFNLPRITEVETKTLGRGEKSEHDRQIDEREDASPSVCGTDLAATSRNDHLLADGPTETGAGVDEKELSTAVKRLLFAEINRLVEEKNRLVEENRQLRQFEDKYHDLDKKLVVLEETIKPVCRNLFLSSACIIAGAAGVAAAQSFLSINHYGWYVFIGVSAMLLIAGIAATVERPPTGIATLQSGFTSK
jgi:hypothetical protein